MSDITQTSFSLNWKIAGKAGEGVMAVSKMVAKICKRHGLNAFDYLEYPSLIKGGHQTGQVFASNNLALCQKRKLDLLITLGPEGLTEHQNETTDSTIIIYNTNSLPIDITKFDIPHAQFIQIPFFTISKDVTGNLLAMNIVALGATAYFLGFDMELAREAVRNEFADKKTEIVEADLAALEAGFQAAAQLGSPVMKTPVKSDNQILVTGNEAIGLGALQAGIQFYSAYPMTPASGLLHFLADQQKNYPLVVKHAEDEIAAINNALGASYAGVRAMTGSSGGGFALMVEGVSFASIAEIPLVILEAQRKGPATGLPTWTEQADLSFVLSAGHGDIERVVLTPGTVQEHYELTKQAFYLAEKYQIPVFILSDKFILESHQTMPTPVAEETAPRQSMVDHLPEDGSYLRYQLTDNGISPRSIPGQAHGMQLTNSYEHDQFGFATEEAVMALQQVDKRAKKMAAISLETPQPSLIGPATAEITLVCWGSTINVISQLLSEYQLKNNLSVNAIHLPCLWPFPIEAFSSLAKKAPTLVMVEGNGSGQAEKLIRQETGITFDHHIRRYDGRPFYVEDLAELVVNLKQ